MWKSKYFSGLYKIKCGPGNEVKYQQDLYEARSCFIFRVSGSFLGARSNKLYEVSKYMALMIFAVMNIVCFGLLFLMPKTKGRPTPDVPIEVSIMYYVQCTCIMPVLVYFRGLSKEL